MKSLLTMTALSALLSVAVSAQDAGEAAKPTAGYDKGFFVAHGNDYALRVNGRLQTRAQYNYWGDSKQHEVKMSVPNARLGFSGHVFEPRLGYVSQLAFDNGKFKLVEFFGNVDTGHSDVNVRVGRYLGGYTLTENFSGGKLAMTDKSDLLGAWRLGEATGVSFYRSKKKNFSFDVSVFENGVSDISGKRRGVVSANLAFNHNDADPADELDLEGGPLRAIVSVGGFGRTQIENWKMVGYAASIEALAKFHDASIGLGFLTGVPEANKTAASVAPNVEQEDLKSAKLGLGGYGQAGYVFDHKFGLAARYATVGNYEKAPTKHEILGSASVFMWDHNVKFQLDGGAHLEGSKVLPQVRGQFQLAF